MPRALPYALFLLSLVVVTGCGGEPDAAANDDAQRAIPVRAAAVLGPQDADTALRFAGVVQAQQRATLTFQVSGVLRQRHVNLGDTVSRGDLLATLYNPALAPAVASAKAQINELQTNLDQAERELVRLDRLRERGAVSEQELEQIRTRRDSFQASLATAQAMLQEAQQMENESRLVAPFDGRVERLLVEQDEFVQAGTPVLRLSSPQRREVEISVPGHLARALHIDQSLPVWQVTYRDLPPVTGRLIQMSQASAERGELQRVRILLDNDGPDAGDPVEVGIPSPLADGLQIPLLSLMVSDQQAAVFRVRDNRVDRVNVDVRQIIGEQVRVNSTELAAGDQVVYAGLTRLVPGDKVELLP